MKRAVVLSAAVLGLALVLPACKCRPPAKKPAAPAKMVAVAAAPAPKAVKKEAMPAEKKPAAMVVEKKAPAKPPVAKMAPEKPKAAKKAHDHPCPKLFWSGSYEDEADRPMNRLRDDLPSGGCCCCPQGG